MKINAWKIQLAQKFLNLLKKELKKIKSQESVTLEMYSNGREQGYHLRWWNLGLYWGCSFSENRNSDALVVYLGGGAFAMQGNVPDAASYREKKCYEIKHLHLAARDVCQSLSQRVEENMKKEAVK